MKKMVSLILTLLLTFAISSPAFATSSAPDENSAVFTAQEKSAIQEQELSRRMKRIQSGVEYATLKDGDIREVYRDEGGIMYVRIEDEFPNAVVRGQVNTNTRTFTFYYENILGNKIDAFRVVSTCTWYSDGMDSYIISFTPVAQSLSSRFSVAWEDSAIYDAQALSMRFLNIRENGIQTGYYCFAATLIVFQNPVECVLDYSI